MDAFNKIESIQHIAGRLGLQKVVENAKVSPTESGAKKRHLRAIAEVHSQKEDRRPIGFMATFLAQCTMPHKNPGNVSVWSRRNNDHTLVIRPGWDPENNCFFECPWGSLARILLIWIVTTVQKTQCRRLELGNSLGEFLKKLELDPYGRGKNSDAKRLQKAMRALFYANMFYFRSTVDASFVRDRMDDASVVSKSELLWDRNPNESALLWGSWIEVGENFFVEIMQSSIPCNMTALKDLRKSPLALDLYILCNWIGANLQAQGKKKHRLSWGMLAQQLGGEYKNQKDLKKNIQRAMIEVRPLLPDLKWKYDTWKIPGKTPGTSTMQGGIVIFPSAPAIQRRQKVA